VKNPSRLAIAAVTGVVLVGLIAAGASARSTAPAKQSASKIKACALLPDTKSSTRYVLFDAPYLKAAFKKAKVPAQVLNALNDPQKQKSQAQQCLAKGAKVILLDQINAASGNAITNLAVSSGAKVIDYDRLVVHSKAAYYVSFDNVRVGRLMGNGLVAALKANGKYGKHPVVGRLNGGVTDNNAHLFRQGYNSVLNPLYNNGTFKKAHGLKPIPLTGQDATPTGVQYILAGWQTGTVYKSVRKEANAAAAAAIAIIKHKKVPGVNGKISGTKSILLTPVWVTKKNYKLLFTEGFLKRSQVCIGDYAKFCK